MKVTAAISLGAMLLLGTQEPVQQRPGDIPVVRVNTRLVNVAVNVTDEHGALIGGLEQDQFRVLEDGMPQKIAIFERESGTPLSMVLALDTSESMVRDDRLARDAAKQFARTMLRSQDELAVEEFSDAVSEVVPFTNELKRVERGLNHLDYGPSTALYDAVYLSAQRLEDAKRDATRRRVIVLVTDGGDTVKGATYTQAMEQVQRAGAMVYCLIIVPIRADAGRNVGGEHALMQMSEDSGGRYYYVDDPKDLQKALDKVSEDLRSQYAIGYYAPPGKPGGERLRSIRVEMTQPELAGQYKLRYRTGYYR